jgi:predicted metalloenzyme YecM
LRPTYRGYAISRLRVALVLLGDAMLCLAIVLISQIDKLVNSTLYNYGLIFSDAWAQPYWLILRVRMVVIVATIFLISVVELPYPAFEDYEKKT